MGLVCAAARERAATKVSPLYRYFILSDIFNFHPHPYGMRLKVEGLSHGLTKCPPDTLLPRLRRGRPFESLLVPKRGRRQASSFLETYDNYATDSKGFIWFHSKNETINREVKLSFGIETTLISLSNWNWLKRHSLPFRCVCEFHFHI